jgi:ABC-type sugar transport system ATPase subunit
MKAHPPEAAPPGDGIREVASTPILTASGIEKTFGRTRALQGAGLKLWAGEVHGLLGANGAGKSTVSKVISGQIRRDAGSILWKGKPIELRTSQEAIRHGITMVMQETSLAPDLTVLENIFLAELGRPGRLSFGSMRKRAGQLLDTLGQREALPLDREVRSISPAQRQLVEIAKALALSSDLIIFDEPTASLSPTEVERLFEIMTKLKRAGHTLVFVSHRLEEVFAITDRVTILREGRTVANAVETSSLTQADIIRFMVGQELKTIYSAHPEQGASGSPAVLEVKHLRSAPLVRDVSFTVRSGEIVGLGGLVGAGRSETLEAIFGLRARQGGEIRLFGKPFNPGWPADAVRAGIGLIAEDRRVQGIVPDFSVRENLLLGHLAAHRGFGLGYKKRKAKVDELLTMLDLPAHRLLDANMLNFSGGMQQKVLIARWLLLEPSVLILDEPTKGVDIGTRSSIYSMLRDIATKGVAVLVVSSDFEELLGLCQRIVVMSDGLSIADVPSAVLDEEKLTFFAAPRTSMKRNTEVLRELVRDLNGAGFWALIDSERLFCLNAVVNNERTDPGFQSGGTPHFSETRIPNALAAKSNDFVREADQNLASLVVPVRSGLGHDMGWVGLVLDGAKPLPPAEQVRQRIETLFAQITSEGSQLPQTN